MRSGPLTDLLDLPGSLPLTHAPATQADASSPANRAGRFVIFESAEAGVAKPGGTPALLALPCPLTFAAWLRHGILRVSDEVTLPVSLPPLRFRFHS